MNNDGNDEYDHDSGDSDDPDGNDGNDGHVQQMWFLLPRGDVYGIYLFSFSYSFTIVHSFIIYWETNILHFPFIHSLQYQFSHVSLFLNNCV